MLLGHVKNGRAVYVEQAFVSCKQACVIYRPHCHGYSCESSSWVDDRRIGRSISKTLAVCATAVYVPLNIFK